MSRNFLKIEPFVSFLGYTSILTSISLHKTYLFYPLFFPLTLSLYSVILLSMKKEPEETKTVRLSLYLPEDIRKALRIRAIEEGISTTKLVERLIRDYLAKAKEEGEQ